MDCWVSGCSSLEIIRPTVVTNFLQVAQRVLVNINNTNPASWSILATLSRVQNDLEISRTYVQSHISQAYFFDRKITN